MAGGPPAIYNIDLMIKVNSYEWLIVILKLEKPARKSSSGPCLVSPRVIGYDYSAAQACR